MSSGQKRLDYIDLLRVLALGSVICFHYFFNGISKGTVTSVSLTAFAPIAKYGYLGVELFFLISGFVILYSTNRTPVEFIKKYIDALAMLKMNTFHWHLTDDQGWRIEIKKYPKLQKVAAFRDETLIGHFSDEPHQFDGKKYGGFYTQKEIKVVPNFIDLEKYKTTHTDCARDILARPEERVITHVSNFRPVKRIADVIDIFYKIQNELPAKLMMVGEGPERKQAEHLCKIYNIEDKVVFLGNSSEVDKILCFSDLFLLPSQTESFGLAALEAMASGVPVISSNSGGIPEVNIEGVSGFLSPVGAIDEMAQNAIKILKDDTTLNTFKKGAQATSTKFDIHKIVPFYEAIYEEALQNCISI